MADEHRSLPDECRSWEERPILSDQRFGSVDQRAKSGQDIGVGITRHDDGLHPKLRFEYFDEGREVLDRPTLGRTAAAGVHDDDRLSCGINVMGGEKRLCQNSFGIGQA
jgi:hypothetical protein